MIQNKNAVLMRRATYASLTVAFVLIAIKFVAYLMTGSVALLSSLIDSVLDSLASILNFVAVRHALEPADEEHRFGHGKAEPLAGLGQAAFIMGSSLFLIFEAINRFVNPQQIEHGSVGVVVMLISLVVTIVLVLYQGHVVKQTGSIAIKADSIHYLSDITLNIGVIIALLISSYTDWVMADPIAALLIAIYIIYSAWKIVKQSLDQLMDRELSDEDREKIKAIATAHPAVSSLHELRTRASGKDIFIQTHLDMDGEISLNEAHKIADEVEEKLQAAFPNADVIIHQDPINTDQ
ncbi:MAG: ferrous-iron efflux pump FieF [Gammaproteobacteria bacterium]|jgi:ferrous-iron efflux pump FieF